MRKIDETYTLPNPGHENTVSVIGAPPKAVPSDNAMKVIVGIIAFRSACFQTIVLSGSPFALAAKI